MNTSVKSCGIPTKCSTLQYIMQSSATFPRISLVSARFAIFFVRKTRVSKRVTCNPRSRGELATTLWSRWQPARALSATRWEDECTDIIYRNSSRSHSGGRVFGSSCGIHIHIRIIRVYVIVTFYSMIVYLPIKP